MKIVIDTNMVIAALVKDSKARQIIMNNKFEFVSPDFVIEEIYKYEEYICKKSGLSKEEFELLMTLIFQRINIIPIHDYKNQIEKAKSIIKEDVKDVPFVACFLSFNCDAIWTNDPDYKDKKSIKTVSTKELLDLIESQ